MLVDSIEIFPTKREIGYLKAIHFKIPVLRNYGDFTDVMTIWDYYPDILEEDGIFNGYSPEDDLPERDLPGERADADGNIPVVEKYGEEEKLRLLRLRLARMNTLRKEQNLPKLTEEEFLNNCRPEKITDETCALVCHDHPNVPPENRNDCYLFVSLFNQINWVAGSLLGAAAHSLVKFNSEGIDFALTALFITVFFEQWLSTKKHSPAIIGVSTSVICVILFGSKNFQIPAMLVYALLLFSQTHRNFCRR